MNNVDDIFAKLASIGVGFAVKVPESKRRAADIEESLLDASAAIVAGSGDRIPAPLFSWISVHGERVNVERLRKLMARFDEEQEHLVWIAAFAFFGLSLGQSRWKLLAKAPDGEFALVNLEAARRLVAMKGQVSWAVGTGFLIPNGSVTISPKNVLSPEQLARVCDQYRNRLIFGTCWRADIATAIARGASTPSEAARASGSSYEPAHRVMQELRLAGYET
jgi:hypothetical protein